jgi:hypothetical protein
MRGYLSSQPQQGLEIRNEDAHASTFPFFVRIFVMTQTIHKIAPAADTVIVLRNPQACFAVWDFGESVVTEQTASIPEQTTAEETTAEETAAEETAAEETAAEETVEEEHTATDEPLTTGTLELPPDEILYEVCSSQLRLASSKFKRMLSGRNWKEGTPNEDDGRYHIPAEDWDEDALLILLNVLHLRNSHLPRLASLDMLGKIVVLADYYNCLEAVKLLTGLWVRDLKSKVPIPSEHCRTLMLWMCIAWILKLPEEFAQTTAIAIRQSRQEGLWTLGLPITGFVGRSALNRCYRLANLLYRSDRSSPHQSNRHSCLTTARSPR